MDQSTANTYYPDYLGLKKLLGAQELESAKAGNPQHDEMLFIIVHQAYELWFKQILHEMDFSAKLLAKNPVAEQDIFSICNALNRISNIQRLFPIHLEILETMAPMDFLEFRNLLVPSSGFQSLQFREIEIKMGLTFKRRKGMTEAQFFGRFKGAEQEKLKEADQGPNLLDLLEAWLERMPFTQEAQFDFWKEYALAVQGELKSDEAIIASNPNLDASQKEQQQLLLDSTRLTFESLFDPKKYEASRQEGKRQFSQKAMLNALFVFLYRDRPVLHSPYRLLSSLIDIDAKFTSWRHRHVMLAHRMLGTKIGTGGTSGHKYLKAAADGNRVYTDLFDLATYIIPRSSLPDLPDQSEKAMDYHFSSKRI